MSLFAFEGANWMPCVFAIEVGGGSARDAPAKFAAGNAKLVEDLGCLFFLVGLFSSEGRFF